VDLAPVQRACALLKERRGADRVTTPCYIDILSAAVDFMFILFVGTVDSIRPLDIVC